MATQLMPQGYEDAPVPDAPEACIDCGGETFKWSPATHWTNEGWGCCDCGTFYSTDAYIRAAEANRPSEADW
jgi:hypothetical protein